MVLRLFWVWLLGLGFVPAAAAQTWTVCPVGCDYSTVSDAISNASTLDGHTINVSTGVYPESFDVDKDLSIVAIDGRGTASIEGTSNDMIEIVSNKVVSLTDLTIGEPGGASRRCLRVTDGSTLLLDGVTVQNCTRNVHGGGMSVDLGGAAVVHDSLFTGNDVTGGSDRRGPHIDTQGDLTISDSRFELGIGDLSGGIFGGSGAVLTVTNTVFDQNQAISDFGGAIRVTNGVLDCQDCEFTDNVSYLEGGAVHLTGNVTASFVGGSFAGNYGWQGGGIFAATSQDLLVSEVEFQSNIADDAGGALFYDPNPDLGGSISVTNTLFGLNAAAATYGGLGQGGAVFVSAALSATIVGNQFTENSAVDAGGGVFIAGTTSVDVLRNDICDNAAVGVGGGIYQDGGSTVLFSNNRWQDNRADDRGGAVYVGGSPVRSFLNNTFAGNDAPSAAGIRCFECDIVLNSNLFADQVGEAINVALPATYTFDYNLYDGNASDIGGDLSDAAKGANAVDDAPNFVDWTADDTCNDDLHLDVGSAAIDAGDDDPLRNDLDGTRNDIGAYGGGDAPDDDVDDDGVDVPADCDDTDPTVYPGAPEISADGVDQDCDGLEACFEDGDGDGDGSAVLVLDADLTCTAVGLSTVSDDCDDANPLVYAGAIEVLDDGIDQDCVDGDLCFYDGDQDGHGDDGGATFTDGDLTCAGAFESGLADDCNDADPLVYLGAPEVVADLVDQDCDGSELCYVDGDGDTYGDESGSDVESADLSCSDAGESATADDCNDLNANVYPGAPETPVNGVDQDCDGFELCYVDADEDDYGNEAGTTVPSAALLCDALGVSNDATDCDDTRDDVHPNAVDYTADGVDSNCNGYERCFADVDGDTFGSEGIQASVDLDCFDIGESYTDDDCDDSDPDAYPGAPEVSDDGIDQDCNGTDLVTCYVDDDQDGVGGDTEVPESDGDCLEFGLSDSTGDCDDADPDRYPGAVEIPNDLIDQDCNGYDLVGCYEDLDLDGYGTEIEVISADEDCVDPGESLVSTDCDDADPATNPGEVDVCGDGLDADCDGWGGPADDEDGDGLTWTDELGLGTDPCDADGDGDGLDDGLEISTGLNPLDADSDGDSVLDGEEVGADPNNPRDTDSDGVIDPLDTDDDGDGAATGIEALRGDSDGDGDPDYLDTDDDGDGWDTLVEDLSGEGDPTNDDSDGDGVPNYIDVDDDQDGVLTADELAIGSDPLSADSDADGILDGEEWANDDSDLDGYPDIIDDDDDNDGILTLDEGDGDSECIGGSDGIPNYLDLDSDGDGMLDADEGVQDSDGDGILNYRDCFEDGCVGDEDEDGLNNCEENQLGTDPNNPDSDGDGLGDFDEMGGDIDNPQDTDGDGLVDALDGDDDGDGVPSYLEVLEGDTDSDGVIDALDVDDDGDGVLTADEDRNQDGDFSNDDLDGDTIPDYLDANDQDGPLGDIDQDGLQNQIEEEVGSDPFDPDTDDDGIGDAIEVGDPANPTDSDDDGLMDFEDPDDDGDGIPTRDETSADIDGDGVPNYLDEDSDGDGLLDKDELGDEDCDSVDDWADVKDEGFCDAGEVEPNVIRNTGGCACNVGSGPRSGWVFFAAVAFLARRRHGATGERR